MQLNTCTHTSSMSDSHPATLLHHLCTHMHARVHAALPPPIPSWCSVTAQTAPPNWCHKIGATKLVPQNNWSSANLVYNCQLKLRFRMLNSNRGCHTFEDKPFLVDTKLVPQNNWSSQTSFQLPIKIIIRMLILNRGCHTFEYKLFPPQQRQQRQKFQERVALHKRLKLP